MTQELFDEMRGFLNLWIDFRTMPADMFYLKHGKNYTSKDLLMAALALRTKMGLGGTWA